jgi:hypothetical protein
VLGLKLNLLIGAGNLKLCHTASRALAMVLEVAGNTGLGDRSAVLLLSYLLRNQLGYMTVAVALEIGIPSYLALDLQPERHLDTG